MWTARPPTPHPSPNLHTRVTKLLQSYPPTAPDHKPLSSYNTKQQQQYKISSAVLIGYLKNLCNYPLNTRSRQATEIPCDILEHPVLISGYLFLYTRYFTQARIDK